MSQILGERKVAWGKLVYRIEDFRKVNDNTEDDAHPLPRIEDIFQKQGNCKIWSMLDLKDGYHQMPLKPEHRHITCMLTPKGSFQWKVLVMGLKKWQCHVSTYDGMGSPRSGERGPIR
jgi:hypothetical protein